MLRVFCAGLGIALALLVTGTSIAQTPEPGAPQTRPQAPPQTQSQPQPPPPPAVQPPVPVRVVDQPIVVRTLEAPKAEAQIAAEQRERDDRRALADQLLIYAALVVAVIAFLAIAFALQTFYLGIGLRAMRRSAQQIDRNVLAVQRAFVYLGALEWSSAGANVRISPIWANAGTTPTRKLRVATNWKASHGELSPDFDTNYVRAPENLFLGPSARTEFGTVFIPMRDIQAAIEQRLHLYIWGRATYADMFEGSTSHFFNFCHRLEAVGEGPDNMALRFTQFGLNNGSDEDRQKPDAGD
jgi:hypothetical protein